MFHSRLNQDFKKAVCECLRPFFQDQAGNYTIIFGLTLPVLVGLCGLGTEAGLWFFKHQTMQGVADSGALSAATANSGNITDLEIQANGVAASYGYVSGVDGIKVTVNRPPKSGTFVGTPSAVEVIVQQPQKRLLSSIYRSDPVLIAARAVANPSPGQGCVLALDPAASSAAALKGTADVSLKECGLYSNSKNASSISSGGSSRLTALTVRAAGGVTGQANMSTAQGIFQNQAPLADPYANVNPGNPPSGSCKDFTSKKLGDLIDPGFYCNIRVNAGASLTFGPGIYWIDNGGTFTVNGGATVDGNGVTLVFLGSATAQINGGAVVNLTAPETGPTAGIIIFGDRNAPSNTTFKLNGGSTQNFRGAIYTANSGLEFAGGSGSTVSCTQLVAKTITFTGNANLALSCEGSGVKPVGSQTAMLVE